MDFAALVRRTRSIRRFKQDPISRDTLRELVELARFSPSGGNKQPLKFVLSCDAQTNARIFPCTAWAGLLTDWPGPAEGERPTGYVVILLDREVGAVAGCDHGIAAQSIVLGAMDKGIGACMIGSLKRAELSVALGLSDRYEVLLVVALGVPAEEVVLEDVGPDGSIEYFRTPDGVHHVPKRPLDELIVG
jgi:nitroreductase